MKRNIKNRRRLHPDDSTSTFLLVEKLTKTESFNPIIIYKPQGQDVVFGSKTYDDLDVSKDLFVLGIQTKRQLEIFVKGAKKVVCIDSTQNKSLCLSVDQYCRAR